MPDETKKNDRHSLDKTLVDNVVEEAHALAEWIANTVSQWVADEKSMTAIVSDGIKKDSKRKSSNNEDDIDNGIFCKMVGKVINEEEMECRFCPLFLRGFLANKDTKKIATMGNHTSRFPRSGLLREGRADMCLANMTLLSYLSTTQETTDNDDDESKSPSPSRSETIQNQFWKLVCVINPYQLSFLFALRNYFGLVIKKDMESRLEGEMFDPKGVDEERRKVGLDSLFDPTPECCKETAPKISKDMPAHLPGDRKE